MLFMIYVVLECILLPLLGTTLGAACVFFINGKLNAKLRGALLGFAAGVMTAASVWSLIIPAVNRSSHLGSLSFLPALSGFWLGIALMVFMDKLLPEDGAVIPKINCTQRPSMLFFAVTLHNLPEGMAVGACLASFLAGEAGITAASAVILSVGIAIQNFPEGSIISMPLASEGESRFKSFLMGFASGVVEPIGAVLTIILASLITPALPVILSFAAGAMIYVTVSELIPKMCSFEKASTGAVMFAIGFTLMMSLDIALG